VDNLNFPLILVIATVVTGVVWLIDAIAFAPKRRLAARGGEVGEPILVEYARSFFPVLAIVLVLRSFVFEPFRIPSGSMIPTLLVGDFILVSKYSYGLRLPVLHTKVLATGEPERGDVAVFRYPRDPGKDYIKRVVGLPGDTVTFQNKRLSINGELVQISGEAPYVYTAEDETVIEATLFQEELGAASHDLLIDSADRHAVNNEWTVPDGHYFMVGDNRDHSNDSRYWGFVPEENLVGRATRIWMHWNGGIEWGRLGDKIK